MFGFSGVPAHCLACDGSAVSRTTYRELFAAIGTTWGAGDGSTTFNLPDFTSVGAFLRSTGGNAAALGVQQGDAMRKIEGTTGGNNSYIFRDNETTGAFEAQGEFSISGDEEGVGYYPQVAQTTNMEIANRWLLHIDSSLTIPTAAENRPINYAVNICIVYE